MEKIDTGRAIVGLISGVFILAAVTGFFPNVLGASEVVWREVVNHGIAWFVGAYIAWIGMGYILPIRAEWPKWLDLAVMIMCFPFYVSIVLIILPFAMPSLWNQYRRKMLSGKVEKDFALLWPRIIVQYRNKGANTHLDELRELAEHRSTPAKVRVRIKKYLRIAEKISPEPAESPGASVPGSNSQTA